MRRFRGYADVVEPAGENILAQVSAQRERLAERLAGVRHVVAVMSGKGGVGKSAITANLSVALALGGRRVGAADLDLNGPSLAGMLGAGATPLNVGPDGVEPAVGAAGVRLISMDLLLPDGSAPLRWRGPAGDGFVWRGVVETGTTREFLADVAWGSLDYLLLDLPPGTDRIERVLDLLPAVSAVLLVTTPSPAALRVVARSARLLTERRLHHVGVIRNMARYVCPCCGADTPLFGTEHDGTGRDGPEEFDLPVWGDIPFDPALADATDGGSPVVLDSRGTPATAAFLRLVERLETELARAAGSGPENADPPIDMPPPATG